MTLKLGLSTRLLTGPALVYVGLAWVQEAERLGFDSIWSS
jgi:hypothetical protein